MQMLHNNDIFLTELENNMFTIKNISKIPEFIINTKDSKQTDNNHKKNIINNPNNIFYPKQRDQLFWIFYIILHSIIDYEMTHNFFTTEKEIKYKWIEEFRTKKELFKPIKVSRNAVEDELANKPKISLKCIKALCYLYDINIFYIDNKKYYEMITNENKPIYIVEKINHKYGLKENVNIDSINYYREHYWKLENLDKPLKAVSSYKVSELNAICNKLNIICDNMTKQKMYQEIMRVL
jgi:hypothetical protein